MEKIGEDNQKYRNLSFGLVTNAMVTRLWAKKEARESHLMLSGVQKIMNE
jgi:hypothetical protein